MNRSEFLGWRVGPRTAGVGFVVALTVAACATRTLPPAPDVLRYPDFVFPVVPAALQTTRGVEGVERGWRYLQSGSLDHAGREFAAAVRRSANLYPAHTGAGYVALARNDHERARQLFERALSSAPAYAPALVGHGQALLALGREADALAAFEAALAADASLTDVGRRIEALRFRAVQALIASGREAADAGRLDDARASLQRALDASPESGLVHRELGTVERRLGDLTSALEHFRRASAVDPFDAVSLIQQGEILTDRGDHAGAEAAYRAAYAIEPTPELTRRIADAAGRARDAALPAEFRAIPTAARVTRGDLAALIGVRLEDIIAGMPGGENVLTDIRGHWAARWITQVERAGVVDAFDNHTFQPGTPVRLVDLAAAVSKLVTHLAASRPELRAQLAQQPQIADVPPRHLNYPQVSTAVASGIMSLAAGNRFDLTRLISGGEAVEAIDRVRALAPLSR